MSNWTRDKDGNYIDWTMPPYYVNGVLTLILPGERDVDPDVLAKRRVEYMKLQRRRLKKKAPGVAPGADKPKQPDLF